MFPGSDWVKKTSLSQFLKTNEYPRRYPQYGGLKVQKTQKELKMKFSSWQEIVDQLVTRRI